ncbi:MAG: hypothetical protein IT311_07570 [Anaerolineales bacterium]|nr:hypothetical protein [Anaerolineales bacterium]MCZ2122615.1 hypothetical protein [Anaerolineales bacterium]
MESQPKTFRLYLPSTILLLLIGWGGLGSIIFLSLPLVWARWGFFVCGILALTGTALPIVYFLHKRFPGKQPIDSKGILRQALWFGIYGATLAWLQLGRLVTIYVILGLAGGLFAAEYFIRVRERAARKLPIIADDDTA